MIKVFFEDSSDMSELKDNSVQLAISSFDAYTLSMIIPPVLQKLPVNDARTEIKKMSKKYNLSLAQYCLHKCAPKAIVAQYKKAIMEIERCLKLDGLFFLEIGHTHLEAEKNLFADDFKTLYPFTIVWDIIEKTNLKLRRCIAARNRFKIIPISPCRVSSEEKIADSVEYWFMFSKTEKWKDNKQIKLPLILNGEVDVLRFAVAVPTEDRVRLHVSEVKRSPKNILSLLIKKFSDEGDLILDAFAGSGTVGIVAEQFGRNSVLYEKDLRKVPVMAKCFEMANISSTALSSKIP